MPRAKKKGPAPNYGDTKLQVLELLTEKPMSIDQICAAKGWDRHVADYALNVLRKTYNLIKDDRHELIPREDGQGNLKVMMLEPKPNALATYKKLREAQAAGKAASKTAAVVEAATAEAPARPAVEPGNVRAVSNRALLDEYEQVVLQKAQIETRLEQLRARLLGV